MRLPLKVFWNIILFIFWYDVACCYLRNIGLRFRDCRCCQWCHWVISLLSVFIGGRNQRNPWTVKVHLHDQNIPSNSLQTLWMHLLQALILIWQFKLVVKHVHQISEKSWICVLEFQNICLKTGVLVNLAANCKELFDQVNTPLVTDQIVYITLYRVHTRHLR